MKPKTLKKLGIPKGKILKETARAVMEARTEGISKHDIIRVIQQLIENPEPLKQDKIFGNSARMMIIRNAPSESVSLRNEPVPFNRWGTNIEVDTIQQMTNACLLPVSVTGALMPDAHLGYGLPIGGVLAVNNAVIPYAVGMDIACRMKLSVLDVPLTTLSEKKELFRYAIETGTCLVSGVRSKPLSNIR